MHGGINEPNSMGFVRKKRGSGRHRLENARFPLIPKSQAILHVSPIRRTSDCDLWMLSWSTMKIHAAVGEVLMGKRIWSTKSTSVRLGPILGAITSPVATSKLAIKFIVPWRIYSNSIRSITPGLIVNEGKIRSRACIPQSSSLLIRWMPCW